MCFVLYAGTSNPLPRKEFCNEAPDLSVTSLSERENPVAAHFTKPQVQYIGSTTGCGCDFPHVMFQNGGWPWFEDDDEDELDRERKAIEQRNRDGLVPLLRQTGEATVELYGVWDGDFATPPANREEISADEILHPDFRFKEKGFYSVRLPEDAKPAE
jgi:hypothetical protein